MGFNFGSILGRGAMVGGMMGGGQMNPGMAGGILGGLSGMGMMPGGYGYGGGQSPWGQQQGYLKSMYSGQQPGVLDSASGGTPMDASQPAPTDPNAPSQNPAQAQPAVYNPAMNNFQGNFGQGQARGPWGAAMRGMGNPGQGYFSQNNMGQFQGTPMRPFGMGNNPMMNMMNPYQGPMQGYGNPNQRQSFMGGPFGGMMGGMGGMMGGYQGLQQNQWQPQQSFELQQQGQAQNYYGGGQ